MYLVEGSFSPIQVQILSTIVSAPRSNANTTLYTNGTFNSYMWSTGDTTSKIIVTQSDSYYITATDHNGNITSRIYLSHWTTTTHLSFCKTTYLAMVSRMVQPRLNTKETQVFHITAGQQEIHLTLLSGLDPGSYVSTVTNNTGCLDSLSFIISTPLPIIIQNAETG